jgi:hypothetical protein
MVVDPRIVSETVLVLTVGRHDLAGVFWVVGGGGWPGPHY